MIFINIIFLGKLKIFLFYKTSFYYLTKVFFVTSLPHLNTVKSLNQLLVRKTCKKVDIYEILQMKLKMTLICLKGKNKSQQKCDLV